MTTIPITLDLEMELVLSVECSTDRNPAHDTVETITITDLKLTSCERDPTTGRFHFKHESILMPGQTTLNIAALTTALWGRAFTEALAQIIKDRT